MKNINPLFENLYDPAVDRGESIGFSDPKMADYWNRLGKGSRSEHMGRKIGGWTGLTLGSIGGTALALKIGKVKERNRIKNIIMRSDSPEDCIAELNNLGGALAVNYAEKVKKISSTRDDWKWLLINSINNKNLLAIGAGAAVGTVGGAIAGNVIGRNIGGRIGYSRYPDSYKKQIPYRHDFNDPFDFDNL